MMLHRSSDPLLAPIIRQVPTSKDYSGTAALRTFPGGPGTWVVLYNRIRFRILFISVSHDVGDRKGDPTLENYLHVKP